jgi:hypothetical protein
MTLHTYLIWLAVICETTAVVITFGMLLWWVSLLVRGK